MTDRAPAAAGVALHHAPPDRAERFGYGRGWLVGSMPMVMQEDALLSRFVTIFEELASTVRYGVDRCDLVADAAVTAAPMVRYLGGWVGAVGATPELEVSRQREIVRVTGATLAWRGTARGVRQLLEAITGGPASVSDGGSVRRDPRPGKVSVGKVSVGKVSVGNVSVGNVSVGTASAGTASARASAGYAPVQPVVVRLATSGHLRADEVVAIVRDEVPAHLPIVVLVAGELVAGELVAGETVAGDLATDERRAEVADSWIGTESDEREGRP